jgi:uncharacterized protein YceK
MRLNNVVLLFAIGSLAQGCCIIGTTQLGKTWETFNDYKAAYVYKNQLVVNYTVTDPLIKTETNKIADRWASVDLASKQPLKARPPLHLHRFPLPARIRDEGQPMTIAQATSALPKGEPLSIPVRDPGAFLMMPVLFPFALVADVFLLPLQFTEIEGLTGIQRALDADPWKHPPNPNNAVEPTRALSGARGSP